MADNTADKEAAKKAKEAERAAKKAKQERIKKNAKNKGPAKDRFVNFFKTLWAKIKKFWKDFTGTIKKIVWPTGKQVLKSSLVVLATILVVGLVIFGIDRGLVFLFNKGKDVAVDLGSQITTSEQAENEDAENEDAEADETSEAETDAA